jgi:hypothetical protein
VPQDLPARCSVEARRLFEITRNGEQTDEAERSRTP